MTHITVRRKNRNHKVPEPSVGDLIALMDNLYDRERAEILCDLEDAQAAPEERMKALCEHRKTKGLTGNLMRSAFTLDGAVRIINWVVDEDEAALLLDCDPEETVRLALRLLGFEDNDEPSAEGKAETVPEA